MVDPFKLSDYPAWLRFMGLVWILYTALIAGLALYVKKQKSEAPDSKNLSTPVPLITMNINSNNTNGPISISNNSAPVQIAQNSPGAQQTINQPKVFSDGCTFRRSTRGSQHVLALVMPLTSGYWDPTKKFGVQVQLSGPYSESKFTKGLPIVQHDVRESTNKAGGFFEYSTATAPNADEVVLEFISDSSLNVVQVGVTPR